MASEDMLELVLKDIITWHSMLHIAYFAQVEERRLIDRRFDSEKVFRSSKGEGDQTILLKQSTGTKDRAFEADCNGELREISRSKFMEEYVCNGDLRVMAEIVLRLVAELIDFKVDLSPAFASYKRAHPHPADVIIDEIDYSRRVTIY